MRLIVVAFLAIFAAVTLFFVINFDGLLAWAIDAQRGFQNQMAGAVRGLKAGEAGAYVALLSAAAAYGFVHALGPGHGKYLVGGVGLGTSISAMRLVGLAVASSIAQSVWAIILVFGGFALVLATARQVTDLTEEFLAPLSYLAIGCVGCVLVWRGVRGHWAARAKATQTHQHGGDSCGCHGHGPTPEEAAKVGSWREAAVLILSIAVRPCTGAVFLLVIAWQMDIKLAGAAAVIVMGLGTAGLTAFVAISSTYARRMTVFASGKMAGAAAAVPAIQMFAGALIVLTSMSLLGRAV